MYYYIGYSKESELRYKASSGGVGSAIIKYLLSTGEYGTSMTFVFCKNEYKYVPKLIYNFSDYNNCGSVYQDVNVISFIRDNISNIKNGIVVTCMPCQVKAIRSILAKNGVKYFIISLCCSGQTTIEGTWYYYKLLGISKENVKCIQYRGNGWPSGIQIELYNGDIIKRNNYSYPWTIIYQSLLFRPKRCLNCTEKTSNAADISLADPWLKEFMENDSKGNSVVICNDDGNSLIKEMEENELLTVTEVDENKYIESQLGTIQYKRESIKNKRFNRLVGKMGIDGSFYKRIMTSSVLFLKIHIRLLGILKKVLH